MSVLDTLIKKYQMLNVPAELDPYEDAFLKAKTMRDSDSVVLLSRVVIASMSSGTYSQCGIRKLIRIYMGQGISFVSVRKDLRCTNDQVTVYQEAVRKAMDEVRNRLMDKIKKSIEV